MSVQRIQYASISKEAFSGFLKVREAVINSERISAQLIALLELRVSFINGCSYCINMHSEELLHLGIPARNVREVAAWQCSHLFDLQTQAALSWADSLTNITHTHVTDKEFEGVKGYYSDEQISDMTMIISNMNAMNRIAIAMRS